MLMPPYHGTTLRADEGATLEFFRQVAQACPLPILVQDAPISGVSLSAPFLARLAAEVPQVRYFKIEVPGAAGKLRELIHLGGPAIEGPWDGEESITLLADLEAGATGTMPSVLIPEVLGQVVADYRAGARAPAVERYERFLPLINYENKQCGLRADQGPPAGRGDHRQRGRAPSARAVAGGDTRGTFAARWRTRADRRALEQMKALTLFKQTETGGFP